MIGVNTASDTLAAKGSASLMKPFSSASFWSKRKPRRKVLDKPHGFLKDGIQVHFVFVIAPLGLIDVKCLNNAR